MDSKIIAEKVEEVFKKLGATDEEIAKFYLLAMEVVTREMSKLIEDVLTENDTLYLKDLENENEINDYIKQRLIESMGKDPQEISDEILSEYLREVQERGYKELLDIAKKAV